MVERRISRVVRSGCTAAGLLAVACGGGGGSRGEEPPASGDIVTWAGEGNQGHDGDGNPPEASWFNQPMELVFDDAGGATIVDWNNHSVRYVNEDGVLDTLIGTPIPGDWPCEDPLLPEYCEVPLTESLGAERVSLNHPMDVVLADGVVYLSAWHNHKIEVCDPAEGTVTVLAGQQSPGFGGDMGAASSAVLNFPDSIVIDSSGALLVADQRNNRIRRISPAPERVIASVAGADRPSAFMGEGVPAVEARLGLGPYTESQGLDNPPPGGGLALDGAGNLYIADTYNHCVRRVEAGSDGHVGAGDPAEELITTVAGACGQDGAGYSGDGGAAVDARLTLPHDLEIGPDGALYVADTGNHAIRRIDLESGEIATVAGTGKAGFSGDGGPAVEATLRQPYGIAFDGEGDLYIVDTMNNRIRRVVR